MNSRYFAFRFLLVYVFFFWLKNKLCYLLFCVKQWNSLWYLHDREGLRIDTQTHCQWNAFIIYYLKKNEQIASILILCFLASFDFNCCRSAIGKPQHEFDTKNSNKFLCRSISIGANFKWLRMMREGRRTCFRLGNIISHRHTHVYVSEPTNQFQNDKWTNDTHTLAGII